MRENVISRLLAYTEWGPYRWATEAQLKRHNAFYAQLVDKFAVLGVVDSELNIRNKLSQAIYRVFPTAMYDSNRSDRDIHLGYWGFSIAILLCCLIVGWLAYSQGRESERRSQNHANYAQSAKESAIGACGGAEPNAVFDCVYEKVEFSADTVRAEQDLDAQQGMKFWAAMMFLTTLATVAITAIGIWFVKRTLDATLEAVAETGMATQAMIRQNEIAEDSMQRQLRAYVGVSEIYAVDFQIGSQPIAVVSFLNNGITPARDLICRIGVGISDTFNPEEFKFPIIPIMHQGKLVLPNNVPGTQTFRFGDKLSSHIFMAIAEKRAHVIIAGYIIYRDVFGKRRATMFRHFLRPGALGDGSRVPTAIAGKGNYST